MSASRGWIREKLGIEVLSHRIIYGHLRVYLWISRDTTTLSDAYAPRPHKLSSMLRKQQQRFLQ